MTAAVEGLSFKCEAIMKALDQAFCNANSTTHPPSAAPHGNAADSGLISAKLRGPNQTVHKQVLHFFKRTKYSKPVTSSTRTLRSHTTKLLSPADPRAAENRRCTLPHTTITGRRSKSAGPSTLATLPKSKKRAVKVSPHFEKLATQRTTAITKVSCVPFPPPPSTSFGLVQERLSHDPFRLLIAVIFLNKTRGSVALPVFYELMERYPTPASLAGACHKDVVNIIQHLGLQNQRATTCIKLAKTWMERPPEKAKRYRVLHYPERGDGKDIKSGEILDEIDERVAWEVGQLPGIGAYAIDSWRIFCRDELRGLPHGLPDTVNDKTKEEELRKEWTRVLPTDKELRAYLRWRWLRNGWVWDPLTGERKPAAKEAMGNAEKGGIIYDGEDMGVMIAEDEARELITKNSDESST